MRNPISLFGDTWRKNWPEVQCGLTGGLPGFLFREKPAELDAGVPVFCYHVIDAETFGADLAFLSRNGYTTLGADALLDHVTERQPAPQRSVVLSFDDGQETLYEVAYPLLAEHGFQAVAFICPGLHREPDDADAQPSGGLCDWAQITQMHTSGRVDFQAHTNSHRYVPAWPRALPLSGVVDAVADRRRPEAVNLEKDLALAKRILEDRLQKNIQHMAFPQYYGTVEAIAAARVLGYRGFWWGVLPGRPMNRPGDAADRIVRLSGEFVRRLPGQGRVKLAKVMSRRYGRCVGPV